MIRRLGWMLLPLACALVATAALFHALAIPDAGAAGGHGAGTGGGVATVLIDAVLYDGVVSGDRDEAVALFNAGPADVELGGWSLSDRQDGGGLILPAGATLAAGGRLWLAWDGVAFTRSFGHPPDWQVEPAAPGVPLLEGVWPGFANAGDEVVLRDATGGLVDVLVYKDGEDGVSGWSGPALAPYRLGGAAGETGLILYRRRDEASGLVVPDSNRAADWAQDAADPVEGRRARYPGWDLDAFFFTARVTETARLTVAVAPDNAYDALVSLLGSARHTIQIETLTLEHMGLGAALAAAAGRGVSVTVLLEGGPVGGVSDDERHICQLLEGAGGACWFMITDAAAGIADRYTYLHAKFIVVDGERVAIASENLSPRSLPDDDKGDGTMGRRGVVLLTDAVGVASRLSAIFAADLAPVTTNGSMGHVDLRRWTVTDTVYGPPPPGFSPITVTGGISYEVRYPLVQALTGVFAFEVLSAPENSLRTRDGLLGLLGRAGPGDALLVQQLHEPPHWGGENGDRATEPNVRLEAYLAAARRGARVRLMLDGYLDDPGSATSNAATCTLVHDLARAEGLDLECTLANPTGLGIHNKMVLAEIDGRGFVHAGSLNGTEGASKINREVALQVQSDTAFAWLADMFARDWPRVLWLPLSLVGFQGAASHVLISEVFYDPSGPDDAEFVELFNPTAFAVDLSGFALADAVVMTDFEDLRRFPPATVLAPGETMVVARDAAAFAALFGHAPDFEMVDGRPDVPGLIDDLSWGSPEATFQLGNAGDEVTLRDTADSVVDAVVYGAGELSGWTACGLIGHGHSLARRPAWRANAVCPSAFEERFPPGPGRLP